MSDLGDWTSFGRVDADGTVYVKTSSGERAVGSWQAGSTEEGLAHFARKYADLVVEVDLIAARLNSESADVEQAASQLRKLREGLDADRQGIPCRSGRERQDLRHRRVQPLSRNG